MWTLITGATGGLGGAFARQEAEKGHDLVLTGTNVSKLESVCASLAAQNPNIKIIKRPCDLSVEAERADFFEFLKAEGVVIKRLINNAGYIAEGEFLSHSDEEIIKIIRVNCEGTVDFTQKVIKQRDANAPLEILTVASLAGYYPMPYMAIYAATKSMLKNLMIALSVELRGKNIFITTLCPSGIPTTQAMIDAIAAQGLGGKMTMCLPEEVAKQGLRGLERRKKVVVPKAINRFIKGISKLLGDASLARIVGKRWKKAQQKRNFKSEETK